MENKISIGQYLLNRLYALGIRHIFGIPGDYILRFYNLTQNSKILPVVTTREESAGFAADAYARMNGLGVVCVTYCVGGLNVANPVAGAYAEKSPVVVISGSPGMKEREKNPLLHHRIRDFTTQKDIFDQFTVASTVLSDPLIAFQEIDRVLDTALRYKRPVYIEIPRDMTDVLGPAHHVYQPIQEKSNPAVLREVLDEAIAMINHSKHPVILADVEVHRFGLQDELMKLVEKFRIPVAATALGKSVVSEVHPLYLGVYEGAIGREDVRKKVEDSDCLIMLGTFMTDINLGIFTANLDQARSIYATSEKIMIRHHRFEEVTFKDFMKGLVASPIQSRKTIVSEKSLKEVEFKIKEDDPIHLHRLFECLNTLLDENMVVIADIGDALFGALDLKMHKRTEFFSPAYYTSMGFSVPAALGAQLANPKLRPIVIVGDGAFQMTGMELSTILKMKLNPIVILFNNQGYGTERILENADFPYNDIPNWQYHRLPEIFGGGEAFNIKTEKEFLNAFQKALANKKTFSLLEIQIDSKDHSPALERICERMAKKI